jgi:hypothetical protein
MMPLAVQQPFLYDYAEFAGLQSYSLQPGELFSYPARKVWPWSVAL